MFGANCFGWQTFAGFAATLVAKRVAVGGAGGGWTRRRPPKLMTIDDARRLVGLTGILVHELDEEAEEIKVLRLLGLV